MGDTQPPYFQLISKWNGSAIREIPLPLSVMNAKGEERLELKMQVIRGKDTGSVWMPHHPLRKSGDEFFLSEVACDTVFSLNKNTQQITLVFTRIPHVNDTKKPVYLYPIVDADEYFVLEGYKKEMSFTRSLIMYDKRSHEITDPIMMNEDNSRRINFLASGYTTEFPERGMFLTSYAVEDLHADYSTRRLKGELESLALALTTEDNPLFMLIKFNKAEE